jgi:hypothetical protein
MSRMMSEVVVIFSIGLYTGSPSKKRHKDSLRLMCLIKQSSVHGYSSDAESIVPTNCQEIVLAVVQLEIILRSLGGGIVLGDDMAQRSVVKNHGSRGN